MRIEFITMGNCSSTRKYVPYECLPTEDIFEQIPLTPTEGMVSPPVTKMYGEGT